MWSSKARKLQPLLAALVLALVVSPVAFAGAAGPSGGASARTTLKQLKALKKQTAALVSEVASLQAKVVALEGRKQPPATPTGPAGGDLSGSYPNPQIRPSTILSSDILNGTITGDDIAGNTIGSTNILDNTIGSADIADNTIGLADLASGSVGAGQLVATETKRVSEAVLDGSEDNLSATCPGGTRLIGGGADWDNNNSSLYLTRSEPDMQNPGTTWSAAGRNNSGATRTFTVVALCLRAN